MRDRLASIDCLRGAAALAVVAHHAKTRAFDLPEQPTWLRALGLVLAAGNMGVPLFFVISGFCIHAQSSRRTSSGAAPGFVEFWKRRLWRLYPPYFVVLCGSIAVVVVASLLGESLHVVSDYPQPHARWIALDFAAHATMLHGLIPLFDERGGNPALWTLAREEYFYLLYFPLLAVVRRWGMRATVLLVFALGASASFLLRPVVAVHPAWRLVLLGSSIVLWIQWCLGMLAAEAYLGRLRLPRWCGAAWAIPLLALVANAVTPYVPDLGPALWGLVFFVLVNYVVRREQEGRWPESRTLAWLAGVGLISYSLYLVHSPVFAVLRQALGAHARTSPAFLLVSGLGMGIAGYLVARVFFALVERHFLTRRAPG